MQPYKNFDATHFHYPVFQLQPKPFSQLYNVTSKPMNFIFLSSIKQKSKSATRKKKRQKFLQKSAFTYSDSVWNSFLTGHAHERSTYYANVTTLPMMSRSSFLSLSLRIPVPLSGILRWPLKMLRLATRVKTGATPLMPGQWSRMPEFRAMLV